VIVLVSYLAIDEGTRFTITVPAGDIDRVLSQTTERLVLDLKGVIVLVIDDNKDVLEGMQRLLSSWDCKPILAESANQAIRTIVEENLVPDIIFAYFRLRNNETGTQAIETIREELNLKISAVIVTGDTSEDRLKEVASKRLRLLHKPITPAEVRTALIQELSGK